MKKQLRTYLNKHTVLYVIGIFLLALGIRLIVDSHLGAAPWDLLCHGLYQKTGISIGTWQIICNISMIIITKIAFQSKWNIRCLIPGIILGLCIDALEVLGVAITINMYAELLLGCLFSGLGLAIYMNQGLSSNAIDNFVYTMNHVKKVGTGLCKLVCDSIPLIVVLALGVALQGATLVVYILVPICMQFFTKLLKNSFLIKNI